VVLTIIGGSVPVKESLGLSAVGGVQKFNLHQKMATETTVIDIPDVCILKYGSGAQVCERRWGAVHSEWQISRP
jgi:hypothetical protein